MCGIVGWLDWHQDLTNHQHADVVQQMRDTMIHRGPDGAGIWLQRHVALGHRRLAVMDPVPGGGGAQPMQRTSPQAPDKRYVIVYNGELYNAPDLRRELAGRGHIFMTRTNDTEVVLAAYIEWGAACVERFNGIFALAIWDDPAQELYVARDRFGVKPLFYSLLDDRGMVFASEMKALLAHPQVEPSVRIDRGLTELLLNGPARTPGECIFDAIREVLPGQCGTFSRAGLKLHSYWRLTARELDEHGDAPATIGRVRELLDDAVRLQLASDVPLATLLSGGLDSSILTSLAAAHRRHVAGPRAEMDTFSVDFQGNAEHYVANAFQPNADAPYIAEMAQHARTRHHSIVIDSAELVDALLPAMRARDLPGMADIDASLLLFSRRIKPRATVALSGEAADEVFGGYPWYFLPAHEVDTFPWARHTEQRAQLLHPDLGVRTTYMTERYRAATEEVDYLPSESTADRHHRSLTYLNITRFMPTLLDRKDRMSMAASLEVRVPFTDHRLVDYVYNVPWALKASSPPREKWLLRQAVSGGLLPPSIVERKKSPYPKTHNPDFLQRVSSQLRTVLADSASPLRGIVHVPRLLDQLDRATVSSHNPWFGQLMSTPQLFGYMLQLDAWLREYRVRIK